MKVLLTAMLSLLMVGYAFAAKPESDEEGGLPDQPMVKLAGLDGTSYTVAAGGDKPELVFIFSTRCPVSNSYISRMISIAKDYDSTLKIIGVNPNETESNEEVTRYVKEQKFPFSSYHDSGFKLVDSWKVKTTPEAFLMDKAGKLVYHGRIDDNPDESKVKSQDLRNVIDKLLAGKVTTTTKTSTFGCTIKRLSK